MTDSAYSLGRIPRLVVLDDASASRLDARPALVVYDLHVFDLHPTLRARVNQWFNCRAFLPVEAGEPTASAIERLVTRASKVSNRIVVSVGGGSTIDAAKGVSYLDLKRTCLPRQFDNSSLVTRAKQHFAIPSTAGPGAEASPAMIYRTEHGSVVAKVHQDLVPRTVVIIPGILETLPPWLRIAGLLDGTAHSLESLLSMRCPHLAHDMASIALSRFAVALSGLSDAHSRESPDLGVAIASFISATGLRLAGVNVVHSLAKGAGLLAEGPHCVLVALALAEITRSCSPTIIELLRAAGRSQALPSVATVSPIVDRLVKEIVLPSASLQLRLRANGNINDATAVTVGDPRFAGGLLQPSRERISEMLRNIANQVAGLHGLPFVQSIQSA